MCTMVVPQHIPDSTTSQLTLNLHSSGCSHNSSESNDHILFVHLSLIKLSTQKDLIKSKNYESTMPFDIMFMQTYV